MKNFLYYILTALIWGSTWLAIKFQLGHVDPLVSVVYRFWMAALLLMGFCAVTGLNLKFDSRSHIFMALQGLFLFGLNYWLVYITELYLPSGLVAIIFSTIVFLNIFNGRIFLGTKVRKHILWAALLGSVGIMLVFKNELFSFSLSSKHSVAVLIGLSSAMMASWGNIISARNSKKGLPVIQTNAFGMLYGALLMTIVSFVTGKTFNFSMTFEYVGSLLYLALFGSIVAFGCYLTLISRIGADRAAYVTLVFPVIALILSTIFEDYMWSVFAFVGMLFILVGNLLIIRSKL